MTLELITKPGLAILGVENSPATTYYIQLYTPPNQYMLLDSPDFCNYHPSCRAARSRSVSLRVMRPKKDLAKNKDLVLELLKAGKTQDQITAELNSQGIDCGKRTVERYIKAWKTAGDIPNERILHASQRPSDTLLSEPSMEDLALIQAQIPPGTPLKGRFVTLRPLQTSDATALFHNISQSSPSHDALWTFMPDGPFTDQAAFDASIARKVELIDPLFFAVISTAASQPVGHVSFMRITLPHRTIELGHILFAASVQRSRLTTESIFLMLRHVFEDLGYRRCEWKCDSRNEPSRNAARRFGFKFEGIFRQHFIVKGRNRDTAWFAILDCEWEGVKRGFERWLDDGNFDEEGRQRRRLEDLRAEVVGGINDGGDGVVNIGVREGLVMASSGL